MESLELFQRLGVALAIGFLTGIERGWKKRYVEDEQRVAGLRTYTLIGLLGGVAGLLGTIVDPLAFAALALIFGAGWIAFKLRETWIDGDLSITGAVAGILVFALGALAAVGDMALAAAAAVVVVIVLAFKDVTHGWVKGLTFEEIRSALFILAATLIALPLLPDRALDSFGAFNPRELWLLTIVIAGASFVGYLALRTLGGTEGLYAGSVVGALVSSTAVTLDLARRTKAQEAGAEPAAGAALLANLVMFVRVGVLIAIFAPGALASSVPALLAAALVSAIAAAMLIWKAGREGRTVGVSVLGSPLDLRAVLRFALILSVITVAARLIMHFYAQAGLIVFAAAAGAVDVDAVALAVGGLVRSGLGGAAAAQAILIAAAVDTVSKGVIAVVVGTRPFSTPYALGSLAALAAGVAIFALPGGG
ncbi:MAG: MgtC/SapB family protein [Hyphomonadaceae bacterium]|nr:MAG: hypothetical protein FD160_1144 [Caulobacteraceae bacterium]MBT9444377.1 MgtC/SapB family protein [Hyphomonadaceae bacterium]TPW08716.1 MAG: hypothetical protein FD124_191 [Alphaproteobacteria bacterium]